MSELVEQADRQYEMGCHKPKWVQCGALCHEKYSVNIVYSGEI